jgi:alpha-1,2-mannosyltransferase
MNGTEVGVSPETAGATRPSPLRRPALQVALLATVTAVVAIGQHWYGNRHHFFDLHIYYAAMRWWADGHPLYDFAQPDATMGSLGFTYPPFGALVLRPIAYFPLGPVQVGFATVSALLFALLVWWLVRPVAQRHGWPRWLTFSLAFVLASGLETIRDTFTLGQINFLLFALIGLDLLVLLPRNSRFVGVGIGLATAIKLVPGIFIVYLLVCRRWKAAGVSIATAAGATLVGFAVAPHDTWVYFTQQMLGSQGVGQIEYAYNQSLLGMLARLSGTSHPNLVVWAILVLPVLGYGLWRASRAAAAGDEVAGLTLAGCVGSLVSPLTWSHHIISYLPALVILVDSGLPPAGVSGPILTGLRSRRSLLTLAAVLYATVTFSVLSLWEFNLHEPHGILGFVLGNWFLWLLLALLILLPVRRMPSQVAVYRYGDSPSSVASTSASAGSTESTAQRSVSSGGV